MGQTFIAKPIRGPTVEPIDEILTVYRARFLRGKLPIFGNRDKTCPIRQVSEGQGFQMGFPSRNSGINLLLKRTLRLCSGAPHHSPVDHMLINSIARFHCGASQVRATSWAPYVAWSAARNWAAALLTTICGRGYWNGAQGRDRTTDTAIFSRMLYQLSYLGIPGRAEGRCERAVYREVGSACPPAFAGGFGVASPFFGFGFAGRCPPANPSPNIWRITAIPRLRGRWGGRG